MLGRFSSFLGFNSSQPLSSLTSVADTDKTVTAIRPEIRDISSKYEKVRDCLGGEEAVKAQGTKYLPPPSDIDDIIEKQRYDIYKQRATFLGVTALTQRTVVGKLVVKQPTIELPAQLEAIKQNINGEGLEVGQLLELALAETFAMGRGGFAADFSRVASNELSMADVREFSPTVTFYRAEDIPNWRVDKVSQKLTMVVVVERYEKYDEFAVTLEKQYRVWMLENGTVKVQVWRDSESDNNRSYQGQSKNYQLVEEYPLLLPGGAPWTEISFAITGSSNNDWHVDDPPLYGIANIELSKFRNSADREEAVFRLGQPTPYTKGVFKEDADELQLKTIRFGSGRFLQLDDNADIGLLQANPNTMIDKLEDDKLKILRAMGAVNLSQDSANTDQTATGAIYQALQAHAPLVTTGRNVVAALRKSLGFAGMFLGIDPDSDEYEVKLNSDILDRPLGVLDMQVASQLYKDGIITWDEVREQARIHDISLHDDPEEARELIEQEGLGSMDAPSSFAEEQAQPQEEDFTTNNQAEVEDDNGSREEAPNG